MLVVGVGDVEVCDPPRWSMSLTPLFTSTTGGTSTVIKVQFPEVVLDKAFEVEGGLLRFPGRLPRVLIARQNLFPYGVIVSPGQTTGPPGSTARLVSGGVGATPGIRGESEVAPSIPAFSTQPATVRLRFQEKTCKQNRRCLTKRIDGDLTNSI